jgi:hypothetical protein
MDKFTCNPLDEDLKYLIVDYAAVFPFYAGQTPEEQFEDEKTSILMDEGNTISSQIKIERAKSHYLGLQSRLANLACYRAEEHPPSLS